MTTNRGAYNSGAIFTIDTNRNGFRVLYDFNPQNHIDMSVQPGGIYLYKVVTENGSLIGQRKLLIDK